MWHIPIASVTVSIISEIPKHPYVAGDHFLIDEISLADDAVLERLNSVLESSRTLTLAEKVSRGLLLGVEEHDIYLTNIEKN